MKKDTLYLIAQGISQIKILLGQSPTHQSKSIAQLQEEIRQQINSKNWVKSIKFLTLMDQLEKATNDFSNLVEDLKTSSNRPTLIRIFPADPIYTHWKHLDLSRLKETLR